MISIYFNPVYKSLPLRLGHKVIIHSIPYSTSCVQCHTQCGSRFNTKWYNSQVELIIENRLTRKLCLKGKNFFFFFFFWHVHARIGGRGIRTCDLRFIRRGSQSIKLSLGNLRGKNLCTNCESKLHLSHVGHLEL